MSMDAHLIYDPGLDAICIETPADLSGNRIFQIKVSRRFLNSYDGRTGVVKAEMSPDEVREFENVVSETMARIGYGLVRDPTYDVHFADIENHILERRSVGLDIKAGRDNVEIPESRFAETVSRCMTRELRPRQMHDAFFMAVMRRCANFSVPGAGKTATTYGMYAFYKASDRLRRILVIGPISSFGAWIDEYRSCFGKNPRVFSIQNPGRSRDAVERYLRYDSGSVDLFLFNYESIPSYGDLVRGCVIGPDTLVVLDEVHRIKAVNGKRSTAVMEAVKGCRYLVLLTGTPLPNSYMDIYNPLRMILGPDYRMMLGYEPGILRDPTPDEVRRINECMYPFYCRTTKADLGVPPPNKDIIIGVDATAEEIGMLEAIRFEYMENPLAAVIRTLQMESCPSMLLSRLSDRDLEDFGLDDQSPKVTIADPIGLSVPDGYITSKTRRCVEVVSGLAEDGRAVVVWCVFIRSIQNIRDMLSSRGIRVEVVYGEVPVPERNDIVRRFKDGEIQVLVANPHTMGEAVSLHTVCHDAVYFEYTYNLVHMLQSKDRIHRLGLPQGQYTQYYFMEVDYEGGRSLDAAIMARLQYKEKVMLDAIENSRFESMPSEEEDLRLIMDELFGRRRRGRSGRRLSRLSSCPSWL